MKQTMYKILENILILTRLNPRFLLNVVGKMTGEQPILLDYPVTPTP